MEFARGNRWSDREEALKASVGVLGRGAASKLFGEDDPIGASVRIGRANVTIVGVLTPQAASSDDADEDSVLLPLSTVRARLFPPRDGRVATLIAAARSEAVPPPAHAEVTSVLRQRRHLRPDQPQDFRVGAQDEAIRARAETLDTLSSLFLAVAAVSLL